MGQKLSRSSQGRDGQIESKERLPSRLRSSLFAAKRSIRSNASSGSLGKQARDSLPLNKKRNRASTSPMAANSTTQRQEIGNLDSTSPDTPGSQSVDPLAEERLRAIQAIQDTCPDILSNQAEGVKDESEDVSLTTETQVLPDAINTTSTQSALPAYLTQQNIPSSPTPPHSPLSAAEQLPSTYARDRQELEVPANGRRIIVQGSITMANTSQPSAEGPTADQSGVSSSSTTDQVTATAGSDPIAVDSTPSAGPSANTPPADRPAPYSAPQQAAVVSRLLTMATAHAASSLLPGHISIGGQRVAPFPGLSADGSSGFASYQPQGVPADAASPPSTPPANQDQQAPRSPFSFIRTRSNRSSSNSSTPTSAAAASPRTPFVDQPLPLASAPAGSFERWLSDLRRDLTYAMFGQLIGINLSPALLARLAEWDALPNSNASDPVLRDVAVAAIAQSGSAAPDGSPGPEQPAPAPDNFAFMRSFRFPTRYVDGTGNLHIIEQDAADPNAHSPDLPSGSMPGSFEPNVATSTAAPVLSPGPLVSPFLIVGVRSVSRNTVVDEESLFGPPDTEPVAATGADRSPLQDSDAQQASPVHSPLPTTASPDDSPQQTEAGQPNVLETPDGRRWIIFIAAGIYPVDHPVFALPLLAQGIDTLGYEDLLRLAALIGTAKSPTISKDELAAASELVIITGKDIAAYSEQGKIMHNTIERCLVCLEDYTAEDQVRLLSCKHAFHKDCVDRWLTSSKNDCPCCRRLAVQQTPSTT